MKTKNLHLYKKLTFIIFVLSFPVIASSQTGPGGVGQRATQDKLVLWLKADEGITKDINNYVSFWEDQSGYSNNANSDYGQMPVFSGSAINSLPAIYFDGAYDQLTIAGNASMQPDNITIFGVAKRNHTTGWGDIISRPYYDENNWNSPYTSYTLNSCNTHFVTSANKPFSQIAVGGNQVANWNPSHDSVPNDETYIHSLVYDGQGMGSYLNNGLIPGWNAYIAVVGQLDYNNNFADISIGHCSPYIGGSVNGHFFAGDIAELIIYNEALIEAEQIIVANSLAAKYNITIGWDMYSEQLGFTNDVIGVGKESDGQHSISLKGQLEISCGLFTRNSCYIFAGHNNEPISGTTINLPSGYNNRLKRIWYIASTGIKPATIELSFILPYNPGITLSEYGLLFSPNSDMSSSVEIMKASSIDINNKTISFSIAPTSLLDGYYTLGSTYNHWTAVSDETWNETANWESVSIPENTDNVKIISQPLNNTFPIINSGTPANTNNLIIESGAALTINPSNSLTVAGNLTNNAGTSGLMIKSDATGTGSLIVEGTSTGEINVERYIVAFSDDIHGWHFLASPVATFNIEGSAFEPGINDDIYGWEESTGLWKNYKAGNPTQIVPGTGYFTAWQSTLVRSFSGTLNNSDISKSNLSYTVENINAGWHLLGNPFPCALKWNATSWDLSNVNGTAKIWNESAASYSDISQNDIIPATQGFMVYVSSGTNSLTIPKADRAHNSQAWYKNDEINKIKLTAFDSEGVSSQESIIKFNNMATEGFDNEFDSYFLAGYAPQFYSVINDNKAVSTNTLPEISEQLSISLSFIKNSYSDFYIKAEGIDNIFPLTTVSLVDLKTNITQNLSENPVYAFESYEGDEPNRFLLQFGILGLEEHTIENNLHFYNYNNKLYIFDKKIKIGTVQIFDMLGKPMMEKEYSGQANIINLDLPSAYYIVRIISDKNLIIGKIYVKK
ncbi:MAG: T9SS type A sorting domain-containing protein [Bacteroidales bacterium]|nr:T9SS type A sorting domain-containing protein [Bacteroidales bacterium]